MKELSFLKRVEHKGFDNKSEMYPIYRDIMGTFMDYEFAYNYISGGAKEDIETATEPGMHLIIEPIILPSVSSALFIGMYGDFEGYLNLICSAHKNKQGLKLSFKDISGNGIERAVTYLEKVVEVKIKNNVEWNELRHWNRVRNILVHNNGVIRDDKDENSIAFLELGIDQEYNKIRFSIADCDKFNSLIVNFYKLCI